MIWSLDAAEAGGEKCLGEQSSLFEDKEDDQGGEKGARGKWRRRRGEMRRLNREAPNGDGRRHQQDQYLKKKRMKELKNIAREKVKQNRRELEDNYLRSQMVEKRRMRIAELAMTKVLHYSTVNEWDIAFTPVSA